MHDIPTEQEAKVRSCLRKLGEQYMSVMKNENYENNFPDVNTGGFNYFTDMKTF